MAVPHTQYLALVPHIPDGSGACLYAHTLIAIKFCFTAEQNRKRRIIPCP